MENKKRLQVWLEKMRQEYRLVILREETLEEEMFFKLTRLNLYMFFCTVFVIMVIFIYSLFAFTPLKMYIPGYGDTLGIRGELETLYDRSDSLEHLVLSQDAYIKNIKGILMNEMDSTYAGRIKDGTSESKNETETDASKSEVLAAVDDPAIIEKLNELSEAEERLRDEIEDGNSADLFSGEGVTDLASIADLYLFSPVKGYIVDGFDPDTKHFGVDVAAAESEPIKAVADGVVIADDWTLDTGYSIAIQHSNNLISFYKHNSVLLKKVGNFVKTGDVIAFVGNSGEHTEGPHLHFELWYQQGPVDPTDYISFN